MFGSACYCDKKKELPANGKSSRSPQRDIESKTFLLNMFSANEKAKKKSAFYQFSSLSTTL